MPLTHTLARGRTRNLSVFRTTPQPPGPGCVYSPLCSERPSLCLPVQTISAPVGKNNPAPPAKPCLALTPSNELSHSAYLPRPTSWPPTGAASLQASGPLPFCHQRPVSTIFPLTRGGPGEGNGGTRQEAELRRSLCCSPAAVPPPRPARDRYPSSAWGLGTPALSHRSSRASVLLVEIGRKTLSRYSLTDCMKMHKGFAFPPPSSSGAAFYSSPSCPGWGGTQDTGLLSRTAKGPCLAAVGFMCLPAF